MNITWTCSYVGCKHKEKTSPCVQTLFHVHNGQEYPLAPFKKIRKTFNSNSIKTLKKEAWDLFSEYIRRKYADENGHGCCFCVTCGKVFKWQEIQAGHYISRSKTMILFDERNVHPQCAYCNGVMHGEPVRYHQFMLDKYGQEVIDELWRLAKLTHKFKPYELKNLINKYSEEIKKLK
jgi:hypothetical protein